MSKIFKKLFCFDENIAIIENKDKKQNEIKDKKQKEIKDKKQKENIIIPNLDEDPFFFT